MPSQTGGRVMKKWIGKVVVQPHGKKYPHQKQALLLEQELRNIYKETFLEKRDDLFIFKDGREIPQKPKQKDSFKNYATKLEIRDGWRRADARSCDIHGCKIPADVVVARVLSQPFVVNSRKAKMTSYLTLSEVQIEDPNDPESVEAAKEQAIEIAENLNRPLTIEILHKVKRPVECGYTDEEVCLAMDPYNASQAHKYCSKYHYPVEDGMQHGYIGILKAIETDRAIAPFSQHAFWNIRTHIRRAVFTSGLIRKGERENDMFGNTGVEIGRDEDGEKIFNRLQSAEVKISDESFNLYDYASEIDEDSDPAKIAEDKEERLLSLELVKKLLAGSELTIQQKTVVCLKYGLRGHLDNPYDPEKESENHKKWQDGWEHIGTEIAKHFGCTRQRIGQQDKKSEDKIKKGNAIIEKQKQAEKEEKEEELRKIDEAERKIIKTPEEKWLMLKVLERLINEKPFWTGKKWLDVDGNTLTTKQVKENLRKERKRLKSEGEEE